MSEQLLKQILDELKQMKSQLTNLESGQSVTNQRLTKIEEQTKDIPLIKQAVLETLDITKQISADEKRIEKKVRSDLNTHEFSIDILNRRQLKLEADLEKLKNK